MNYNDSLNFHNKTQLKQSAAQLNKAKASTLVNGIKKVPCLHCSGFNKPKQNNQSVAGSEHIKGSFVLSLGQKKHWRICVCAGTQGSRATQINNGILNGECACWDLQEDETTPILIHTVKEICSRLSRSSFYTYLRWCYVTALVFVSYCQLLFLWLLSLSLWPCRPGA